MSHKVLWIREFSFNFTLKHLQSLQDQPLDIGLPVPNLSPDHGVFVLCIIISGNSCNYNMFLQINILGVALISELANINVQILLVYYGYFPYYIP